MSKISYPNTEELKSCITALANAMKMRPLPDRKCLSLINHVLYNEEYDGVKGKDGWPCFKQKLLTEREIRNLLMAHSATKVARFNEAGEPGCNTYSNIELCSSFEHALLGRLAQLGASDLRDPWEKMHNQPLKGDAKK